MLALSEIIGKRVKIKWNEEIRRETFIDHEYIGTVYQVKDKGFSYEVIHNNKRVFTFSWNDYRRGIINAELI